MTHDLVSWLRACATNEPSNDDAAKLWGAAVRIEYLERENANLRAERDAAFAMSKCECGADEACANLARLRAEKDELRKALEPFAKLAGRFMDETSQRLKPDDHNVWGYGDETLTYGDFRRARALLSKESAEQDGSATSSSDKTEE